MADGLITALGIGGQLIGGLFGADAAGEAADTQAAAGRYAADLLDKRWNITRNDLLPFIQRGQAAADTLAPLVGVGGNPLEAYLTRPFAPTDLESTPGYRFVRDQGLKSVQNSFAAKGLGSSGAAMRGAARYATGLADNTYNTQLQNDMAQRKLMYEMLMGMQSGGQNAAAQSGNISQQLSQAQGNLLTGIGNVQGAGIVGGANALISPLSNIAQTAMLYGINPGLFSTGNSVRDPRQQTAAAGG